MNIRKTICLLCCVSHTVLALACGQRQQAMKPVVIVEDEQSADDKWLSMCSVGLPQATLLGFNKEAEADHYLAQLLWRDNRWSAALWRDTGDEQS